LTADSGFPAADRIDAAEQYGFAGLQFEDDGCFRRAIAQRFQRCTLDAFAQPAGVVRLDGARMHGACLIFGELGCWSPNISDCDRMKWQELPRILIARRPGATVP